MNKSKLGLDQLKVEKARSLARTIAEDVQSFVEAYTTVAVERTICRLLGIDGVDENQVPLPNVVVDAVHGEDVGTRFANPGEHVHGSGRRLWIGLAEIPHGTVEIDDGARHALLVEGASLLPVGVCATSGTYREGDVIRVVDSKGREIARGVTRYSSEDVARVRGLKLDVIARFLPHKQGQPVVHRDELLVF